MSKEKRKRSGSKAPVSAAGPINKSAKDRREERQREKRRQQQTTIALVIGAIAVLVLIAMIVRNLPADAPLPAGVVERYQDVPASVTDRQFPRLGSTNNTISVVEYSSFSCAACAVFHSDVFPSLLERIKRGEISYTFVPLTTGSVPNAQGAARAALCVQEQNLFWPYHDVLFSWQETFGNGAFSAKRLETAASELGLDVNAYNACITSNRPDQIMEAAQAQFRTTNFTGTPSVTVQGVELESTSLEAINQAIDARLQVMGVTPTTPEEPAATTEAVESTPDEPVVTEEATEAATEEPTEAPTDAPADDTTPEATPDS